jgi:hypothetical protein
LEKAPSPFLGDMVDKGIPKNVWNMGDGSAHWGEQGSKSKLAEMLLHVILKP